MVEQVVVIGLGFGVGVVTDFESGAVGGQARVECRGDTRTEVATDASSAHQSDLGLDFLEEVDKDSSVRVGSVGVETLVIDLIHGVGTVGEHLLLNAIEISANDECL